MANLHVRSNSLPSKSHPMVNDVEDHLCRIRGSESTSTSAPSVCSNLANMKGLHEAINNLIQMPSIQEAVSHGKGDKWTIELLDESLVLVDLCGFAIEVVSLTKESVQELESSIRRNRGETATTDNINAYMASRKMINKMINKCIKNLKSFDQNSTVLLDKDDDLKTISTMLKETEALGFLVLKSVLILVSGTNGRSKKTNWSFLSKFTQSRRVNSEIEQESGDEDLCSLNIHKLGKSLDNIAAQNVLNQLKSSELIIQELEEGLETFFKSLVRTRVSLLNVLNN